MYLSESGQRPDKYERDPCWNAVLLEYLRGELSICHNPNDIIGVALGGSCIDRWFGPSGIILQNLKCADGERRHVRIQYSGICINSMKINTVIPLIKVSQTILPALILPETILSLKLGHTIHYKYHDTIEERRQEAWRQAELAAQQLIQRLSRVPSPQPPPVPQQVVRPAPESVPDRRSQTTLLPKHIVRLAIESSVKNGEDCPINLEPLTIGTAVITPCGHVISRLGGEHWMSNAHSCPVCRAPCSVEQLQQFQ
jgi:hypothetical protein